MAQLIICCAALAAFSNLGRGGQAPSSEMVIRLHVQAMPEPKPALRYLLLPELKEMNPGNPVPNYLKCMLDNDSISAETETLSRAALRDADRAARMDKPDWQILLKVKTDGINLLIPDVQKLRYLGNSVQGRFREEVAQQRFDDALVSAKTLFAMSRHMSEHPTLIGQLVGIAIASITIGPLEEMLQQPGCPNLYWALTNLPNPLVPLDKGLEFERMVIQSELPELNDREPLDATQIEKLIKHLEKLGLDPGLREWLSARTKNEPLLGAARRGLLGRGVAEERVRRFPVEQILLLDAVHNYEIHRDEVMKLMSLPTWQTEAMLEKIKPSRDQGPFKAFLPAVQKVRRSQGRLEQRLALLRQVEALRLFAAEHAGKFPDKLDELSVPVPLDPFTGKPFRYELTGGTAHLRGTPPHGLENESVYNVHYELTIQK